jgi:hypothetical protein
MANTRQTQAATTTRDSDFISGCPGRTHGTLFEIAGNRSTARNDSRRAVDSFRVNGRGQNEIGLTSGLLWPGTAPEQARNRSPRTRQRRGIVGELQAAQSGPGMWRSQAARLARKCPSALFPSLAASAMLSKKTGERSSGADLPAQ